MHHRQHLNHVALDAIPNAIPVLDDLANFVGPEFWDDAAGVWELRYLAASPDKACRSGSHQSRGAEGKESLNVT